MIYKKLHRTIEQITSRQFDTEEDMLISVLNELVEIPLIEIIGGRIWKLRPELNAYTLLYQTGNVDKIGKNFKVFLKDYPVFEQFDKERTIYSDETNPALRKKGIFRYSASGVGYKTKIGEKRYYEYLIAFNSPQLTQEFKYLMNIIASVITSKIKERRTASQERSLRAEMDKARDLQRSILPQHEYKFYDYELYGVTVPAETVGGDFFDYVELGDDNDRLGIALGDAASKGIGAAAEALYISGALRMASTFELKIIPLMKRLNKLVHRIFGDDRFSSLFYCELSNDPKGLCIYANAGHNPPYFLKKGADKVILLQPTGPVLGPSPNAVYTLESINFSLDDILLIFSDGMIESTNSQYDVFGEDRLEAILYEVRDKSAKEIALRLIEAVVKFSKNGAYSDDKTVVVIKKTSK